MEGVGPPKAISVKDEEEEKGGEREREREREAKTTQLNPELGN